MDILGALMVFGFRVTDMTLDTFRVLLIVQGRKYLAGLLGATEVFIFLIALTRVIGHLDNPLNFVAYCMGFGVGNVVGLTIEEKTSMGRAWLQIIARQGIDKILEELRKAGFGVTRVMGEGQSGPISILYTVAYRKDVPQIFDLLNQIDPHAFVTVLDTRKVLGGHMRVMGKRK
jgi:uncharacterized protein YebE (UPF0316 family)